MQNTDSSVNFSASSINGNIASVSGLTINPVSTGKTQIIVSGGGRQTTVEVTVLMNGYKTLPQVAAGEGLPKSKVISVGTILFSLPWSPS